MVPSDFYPVAYQDVLLRDPCVYCGKTATTIDHIRPRSLGGQSHWVNLAPACVACNGKKGSRSVLQMLAHIDDPPRHFLPRLPPHAREPWRRAWDAIQAYERKTFRARWKRIHAIETALWPFQDDRPLTLRAMVWRQKIAAAVAAYQRDLRFGLHCDPVVVQISRPEAERCAITPNQGETSLCD